ncbi:MAG: D-alanine--D-alanine ligase, partial [Myxococcota bacterium]
MTDRRIAVFRGGPSAEHDVSLESGRQVLQALGEQSLDVVIRPDGAWTVAGVEQASLGAAIDRVRAEADVAFVALHGPYGEDGVIQGLLEVIGLPYTGSGVAASSLAMDKVRTKAIYRDAGLPTAAAVVVEPLFADQNNHRFDDIEKKLGFPCVVKPACDGSSFGVSLPSDRAQLASAIEAMQRAGRTALAEKRIVGKELTCAVLDFDDGPRPLPVTEIAPADKYAF